jgi:O-antigen/teichoic acid export membrane protein
VSRLSRLLSDEGLTRKASLNAFAAILDYASRLVAGFVMTPFLVRGLGDQGYGIWQVLDRFMTYLSPATGRPSQALKWTIARHQSSSDYEEKRRQVGSAVMVWLSFLPLLIVIGAVLAWVAPALLKTPPSMTWSVRVATLLLVANSLVFSLGDVPRSVVQGENLGYKRMGLSTALVFASAGLTALALYLNGGLVGVVAADLAHTLLGGLLMLQVARANIPWFGIAKPLAGAVRRFLGLSGWFLAWNLVMRLMRATDVVVLGVFGSPEMVTMYTLTRYAPETVVFIVATLAQGVTPGLGGIVGSGDKSRAQRLRAEIMTFTWLLVAALGATILLWNRSLLQVWVGGRHYLGAGANLLLMAMVAQFVMIRNDANIIDLTLNLRSKVLIGFLSAALSAAAAAYAVGILGLGAVGVCLGFIAGRSILSIGYPLIVGRSLGVSLGQQLRATLRPGAVTAVLFGLSAIGSGTLAVASWWLLAPCVVLTLPVATLAAFQLGLGPEQRDQVVKRIRRALRGRAKDARPDEANDAGAIEA